jgi:hypothetical protein
MDTPTLTAFFMWCTIINGAILMLFGLLCLLVPDWLYCMQQRWFPIPQDVYNIIIYCFLGSFKILYIVFNLVPYIALLIAG